MMSRISNMPDRGRGTPVHRSARPGLTLVSDDGGAWSAGLRPVTIVTIVGIEGLVRAGLEAVVAAAASLRLAADGDGPTDGGVLVVGSVDREVDHWSGATGLPVIVVADAFTDAQMFDLLRSGAAALLRHTSVQDLLEVAVRAVCDGGCFIDPTVARRVVMMAAVGRRMPGLYGLTVQEQRVLALVAREMTNREIAAQLGLSPNTVKSYVRAAMRKLGAADRQHAVQLVGLANAQLG